MPFLYEKIDTLREVGVSKELPQYIQDNLNRILNCALIRQWLLKTSLYILRVINFAKSRHKRSFIWQQAPAKHLLWQGLCCIFISTAIAIFCFL